MANASLFFDVFARDKTGNTFKSIIRSTDTLGGKLARFGKLAAGAAAVGIAAFAVQGVRNFLKFDDAMTQSLAIMGNISGPMRDRMETAAREVGKTTRFGATQAAEAYFYLASAGLDAEQAVAAMPQVAKFATAGMFDLSRATDLATDAQTALGLSTEDPERNLRNLTRVTDVLVGANTLANASVEQFSTALTSKAGPAMRAAGIEIEEGVAVLAAFADAGVKGDRAGTLFAATLEQLQRNAINNADEFERLGISVFDAQGNMRNFADITADLESAFAGMSVEQQKAAIQQLGFNRSALEGINLLLGSSEAIRGYEDELQRMGGITEQVADEQMGAFAARLAVIKSRLEDVGLTIGKALVTAVFSVGEHIGEMARMFGELPDAVQKGVLALGGIVAAAPLAIGAWKKVRAAVDAVRLAYLAMGTTARVATLAMGGIGLALAAGAAILAFFANRNLEAQRRVDELAGSLERQTGAVSENTREIAFNNLEQAGAIEQAKRLGIELDTLIDAYLGDADAIAQVEAATAAAVDEKGRYTAAAATGTSVLSEEADAADNLAKVILEGNSAMDEARRKQVDRAAAGLDAADADGEVADAAAEAAAAIAEQVDAVDDLISSLDEAVKSIFAARDAEVAFEDALDSATDSVDEHGATLDITTDAGRRNRTELDRVAQAALRDAAATLEDAEAKGDLAAGHEEVTAKMERARSEFIKLARQMGLSKKEAEALADELGLIPGNYKARITADTSGAVQQVKGFVSWVNRQTGRVKVVGHGFAGGFAEGGFAARGTTAMVGEEGPELVTFAKDAQVHTAAETRRILAGGGGRAGGGSVVNVYLTNRGVLGSEREVQMWFARTFNKLARVGDLNR
jgi:TP901 family phage tail tape measure protein